MIPFGKHSPKGKTIVMRTDRWSLRLGRVDDNVTVQGSFGADGTSLHPDCRGGHTNLRTCYNS